MAKIEIIQGNIKTGDLWLSDCGHTWEIKGNHIEWNIRDPQDSNVASIEDILVTSRPEIFEKLPAKVGNKWMAKLSEQASDNAECKYSIFWKDKDGKGPFEHDPKISVMPTKSSLITLLVRFIFSILTFVGLGLLFKKIKR